MRLALEAAAFIAGTVLLVAAGGPPTAAADGAAGMTTVDQVDLARYVGLWYEVAKIPNRFQKQCARGATAEYVLRDDGRITVINRCVKHDGGTDAVKGEARVVDADTQAKLEVSFVSFLGWRPFWGDYWVIGLDEDYRWAVVGTPDRKYGWVLSRTPALDGEARAAVEEVLRTNGYDPETFVPSPH